MSDLLQLGPLLVKTQSVVIAVSAVCGYLVLRYRLQLSTYSAKLISDTIENGLILFLVLWKFSIILVNPAGVIANPLALLYFSGGVHGLWLAAFAVTLYLYYRRKKDQISLWVYADLLGLGYLAASVVFDLLSLVLEKNIVWANLSQALIFLVIIFVVFLRTKLTDKPYHLTQVLLCQNSEYFQTIKETYLRWRVNDTCSPIDLSSVGKNRSLMLTPDSQ